VWERDERGERAREGGRGRERMERERARERRSGREREMREGKEEGRRREHVMLA
jgi:hypothetical protein